MAVPGAAWQRGPATEIADRVKAELTRPIRYQDREHVISVSVGVTFAQAGGLAEDALRDADMAMYRAKQSGKNRVATFDDSLRAGIFERANAERALHAALDQGGPNHPQLTVCDQPVIDLDSGRLAGFEALPRLTDPTGEPIRHEVFTYVAEHTAMVGPLGEAVLDTALAALARWRAEHPGSDRARIAVNMSARQAQQADMPALVRAALETENEGGDRTTGRGHRWRRDAQPLEVAVQIGAARVRLWPIDLLDPDPAPLIRCSHLL